MDKRGQFTVFVILGIIIIALILLFLFVRKNVYTSGANIEDLEKEFPDVEEHIEDCLEEVGDFFVRELGKKGGFLNSHEDTFRRYNDIDINYLCYNIEGRPYCSTRMLTLKDVKNSLDIEIKKELDRCINIDKFNKYGLDVTRGSMKVDTSIGMDNVVIGLEMPIVISKENVEAKRDNFMVNLKLPLGRLLEASKDIIDSESTAGYFETLTYSVFKTRISGKPYVIQKLQPYPDKLYVLKIQDIPSEENEFIFQFFVQGEPL